LLTSKEVIRTVIAISVRAISLTGGRILGFALIIVALIFLLLPPSAAQANSYYVTNTNDSGAGSLRQAILDAYAHTGSDDIYFNLDPGSTIVLTSGELVIDDDLDIVNSTPREELTISGNDNSRVFRITSGKNVTIANLTISDGYDQHGAGIQNSGTLYLLSCIVEDNHTSGPIIEFGGDGGGIQNFGDLTAYHCIIRWNTTGDGEEEGGGGAGIYNEQDSTAEITRSTIHGNVCGDGNVGNGRGGSGGGIYLYYSSMVLTNCTVSGNSTGNGNGYGGDGGGICSRYSTCAINNCTITGNSAGTGGLADGDGGGIYDASPVGTIHARSSIIAGNSTNSGSNRDIFTGDGGAFCSHGCNIIYDTSGWTYDGSSDTTGDQLSVSPMLGALADNGGYAPTHALQPDSPAIDGVIPGYCSTIGNGDSEPVTSDERDIHRPLEGDGIGQALCDIGAYEYDEYVSPTTTPPSPPSPPGGDDVGGEVYPVNKLNLLWPWVILSMVVAVGAVYLVRRRVHN
jgi:hypothetical protein